MMKEDNCPIFDLDLMDYFYDPNYEKDKNVINAWYLYVMKILPLVSKKWKDATTPEHLSNETSMFHYITISDEAIMRWFLKIWVPKLSQKTVSQKATENENAGELNKQDDDNKLSGYDSSKRKRGPHDTNVHINIYTTLFHNVSNARSDHKTAVRWNKLFWDEVKKRNAAAVLGDLKTASKRLQTHNNGLELCLPDLNENQEFLASYTCVEYDEDDEDD